MDSVFPLQCCCPVDQHMPYTGMASGKLEISCLVPSTWKALCCAQSIPLHGSGLLAVPFSPQHL